MDPDCPAISLTPSWKGDPVLLVGAVDAIRLCREGGYAALEAGQAVCAVESRPRRLADDIREFLARASLSSFPLSSLDDFQVIQLIAKRIRSRDLVAVQRVEESSAAGEADKTAELRRLVRDIESKTRGRLAFAGRQYKLVVDAQLANLPGRDNYQVVPRDEAQQILSGIASQPGTQAELKPLLAEANSAVSPDWRPPLNPDGLVLLRRIPTVGSKAPEQVAPMTPSQLRKAMLTWITIDVVDEDDNPWSGAVDMTLTNGSQRSFRMSEAGTFHQDEIQPGTVTVKFKGDKTDQKGWGGEEISKDKPPVASRVRMVGMLFDANKCFLLPQALPGIKMIVGMHQKHPSAEVLIVGHAGGDEDLAGTDIAVDRAEILAAYLTSKSEPWLTWFGTDKAKQSRWGTREVQLMLSALPQGGTPFYEGNASGVTGKQTVAAITAFQKYSNKEKGTNLAIDGKAGPATCKALVTAYMGLENTTLAEGITPVTHGCDGHFDDTATASGLQPDDRRIEVFFFDNGIDPKPAGATSDASSSHYADWLKLLVETKDFENHGIHVLVLDSTQQPVPGAKVTYEGPTAGEAQADDHGFVTLMDLKAGEYTIHAEKEGYSITDSKLTYPTAKTVAPKPAEGTKPIYLRLRMDPDKAAALKEKFRLFSTDGSYSKTEATDRIKGNDYMDLMFDAAPTNLSYSLEVSAKGIKTYLLFEDIPFAQLHGHT